MPRAVRYGAVVTTGLLIRLALLGGKGFPTDIGAFAAWAVALATAGPHQLYADVSGTVFPVVDYPPAYAYVLWAIGLIAVRGFGLADPNAPLLHALVKLPAIAADFALAGVLHGIVARLASERAAFAVFAGALLLPPLWLVSAYWGQVDSVAACLFMLAVWVMLRGGFVAGWAIFTLAVMTKPQALVALPALAAFELRSRGATFGLLKAAGAGVAIVYLLALPFAPAADPPGVLRWVFERYAAGVGKYPNGSTGAFNLYGIANHFYSSDAQTFVGLPLRAWGTALVVAALAAIAIKLWRLLAASDAEARERALLYATFLSLAALFMLATRMHERYLMPALAAGAVVAACDRRAAIAEGVFATTFTLNCAFILAGFAGGKHHPITLVIGHALSLANVATFVWLGVAYFTLRTSRGMGGLWRQGDSNS